MIPVVLRLAIAAVLSACVAAKKITWVVKKEFKAPDCVDTLVVTINGGFPGPTLRLQPGELLELNVENQLLNTALSVHFHGQEQTNTPWQDGASMVSSCPIPPMSSYTYRFHVNDKPGTYQYHAHVGFLRLEGMSGSLIIEGGVSPHTQNVAGDFVLNALDWWHATGEELGSMLMGKGADRRWIGAPQTILVNGKGVFNCTENQVTPPWWRPGYHPDQCTSSCGYESFDVDAGKTYLLRFINGGSLTLMNFAIDSHNMTVVEVDGMPTQPYVTETVDFNSGQRVGVLVTMDQAPDIYEIRFAWRNDEWSEVKGYALLKYSGVGASAEADMGTFSIDQPAWNEHQATLDFQKGIRGLYTGPSALPAVPGNEEVERRFVLLVTNEYVKLGDISNVPLSGVSLDSVESQIGAGTNKPENFCTANADTHDSWLMGRRSYKVHSTPTLSQLYFDIGADELTEDRGYYKLELGKVYDIVVQSYQACYGKCEQHAWHMHGSHFWVLGSFRGKFTGSDEQLNAFNVVDPPIRDTVINIAEGANNAGSSDKSCGYTVIRLKLTSPGVWPFHCHHAADIMSGLGATFYTSASTIPAPPENLLLCGAMTTKNVAPKMGEEVSSAWRGSGPHLVYAAVFFGFLKV